MCSNRILSRSDMGFVNQCDHCRTIHLAFGTAVFSLSESEFIEFCNRISDDISQIDSRMNTKIKCIRLSHPSKCGFSFVLTVLELQQLNALCEPAQFLLSAYNLIRDDETLY